MSLRGPLSTAIDESQNDIQGQAQPSIFLLIVTRPTAQLNMLKDSRRHILERWDGRGCGGGSWWFTCGVNVRSGGRRVGLTGPAGIEQVVVLQCVLKVPIGGTRGRPLG